jgi:hypothetical protein
MPQKNPTTNDALGGLLGALLGGHPAVQGHMQNTGQSLDDVLARISDTANAAPSGQRQTQPAGGDPLGAILGGLLGGGMQQGGGQAQSGGGDAMSAILGSLLGGATQQGGGQAQSAGSNPLGDILGSLLGGAAQQQTTSVKTQSTGKKSKRAGQTSQSAGSNPLGDILGGLLGGGASQSGAAASGSLGNNAFVASIVDAIAAKIGIPPQIAQIVVSLALSHMMSGQGSKLTQSLASQGTVTQKYLKDSGLVSQVTQQTGVDNATAAKSLQQAFQALGTQMGPGTMADRQKTLAAWRAA